MKKISISGGFSGFNAGGSYEWDGKNGEQNPLSPVMDIQGTGQGWTKVTKGNVKINSVPGRTTVRISGPGGWYIQGNEQIG